MHNVTKEAIDALDFNTRFNDLCHSSDRDAFFDNAGKQHYRLLAYFTTLFNNSNIIDIGSQLGNSALALSYNKSNTIHSFDTLDKVHDVIKNVDNIKFYVEDLLDRSVFDKWQDTILSCPFILVNTEPHNGHMELTIYNYLKSINYTGFIIFDNIWHLKEMRDNFWYSIPDAYKYDLTDYGCWSGTGIVTFNPEITFNKYDNTKWTLVTAYFNLTKCPDASDEINARGFDYYLSHAKSTLALPYNLVIYCDAESIEEIKKCRPSYLDNRTEYIICDFEDFRFKKNNEMLPETFANYREKIIVNRQQHPYHFDKRNTASYYLFCMSRYSMLKDTISRNTFKSTHFAWINFCIERMGYQNLVKLDEGLALHRDKFSTCYIDYIPPELIQNTNEYFKWGRCSMCSGFFTGNAKYMYEVCDLIENKFLQYLDIGYGHADEQLFSPVYFEHPDLFDHYYGDYQQMITNYRYVYERAHEPIHNFIRNSYNNKNYIKCYEACEYVWKSYKMNKCLISDQYVNHLTYYYTSCKAILGNNPN